MNDFGFYLCIAIQFFFQLPSMHMCFKHIKSGAGAIAQQVKPPLGAHASPTECLALSAGTVSDFQLPANVPGREQVTAQEAGFLPPAREPGCDSWLTGTFMA